MDCSEVSWLSEMGLDNSFFMDNQCDLMEYSLEDEIAAVLGQDFDTCLSAGHNSSSISSTLINTPSSNSITSLCADHLAGPHEPPPKLQKPNNFSSFSTNINNSAPIILNFGNAAENHHQQATNPRPLSPDEEAAVSEVLRTQGEPEEQSKQAQPTKKPSRIRPPSQTYDHIVAERKRREQLSQRFVALSTIVPGLKKMDKTSVLGDAIKYLKHLQERVKTLEEQSTKQTMESVVLVKKSQIMAEDEGSSDESDELPLPEIEARVCNSQILLRVHCERQKGVLVNLLGKVEKLNLAVVNTNVTPFGSLALDITIVAEMEKEFDLTVKEVVKRLRAALTLKQLGC
ncbi:transcription factor bhlh25 [Phtheirospermum japonicum]|uniref:Transcription factor bhlh25 n=1 Tax=Phtheirospermum japonicum TaxID=374723 RepID=A0A830B331_9LAMI|nr:transcription factor bhlh25 [Phtheirospermum japonicum]